MIYNSLGFEFDFERIDWGPISYPLYRATIYIV